MSTKQTPERVRLQRELAQVQRAMSSAEKEDEPRIAFPSLNAERDLLLKQLDDMNSEVQKLENRLRKKQAKRSDSSRRAVMESLISLNVKSFEREIIESNDAIDDNDPLFLAKDAPPRMSASLSGLIFTRNENFLLPLKPGMPQLRRYHLEGRSRCVPFVFKFEVDETTTRTVSANAAVAIEYQPDLEVLVSEVSETKDVNLFFRGLDKFSELCEQRSRIIRHFIEKYPDEISICRGRESSSDFHFKPTGHKEGFQFTFAWDIEASDHGSVFQSFEVIPRVSKQYIEEDKRGVIINMNRNFHQLVQLRGLRSALQILISAIIEPEFG